MLLTAAHTPVDNTAPAWKQAGAAPALAFHQVSKTFGSTVALDQVSLTCVPGKIHCVLGENGSGKSTMVKLMSGVLAPDHGTVRIGGIDLHPATPQAARKLGVATVFQETLVAETRSVTENVLVGLDGFWRRALPGNKERTDRARSLLGAISGASFNMSAPVRDLGLVQRHQVTIARALALEPSVLILDESTAALDVDERDRLFQHVRGMVAEGTAVIFISHRLDEVLELSDRVTVMRSGRLIRTLERDELSADRLIALITREED